jgi:hypothetical protein
MHQSSLIYPVHKQQAKRKHDVQQKNIKHPTLQNLPASMQQLRAGTQVIIRLVKVGFHVPVDQIKTIRKPG